MASLLSSAAQISGRTVLLVTLPEVQQNAGATTRGDKTMCRFDPTKLVKFSEADERRLELRFVEILERRVATLEPRARYRMMVEIQRHREQFIPGTVSAYSEFLEPPAGLNDDKSSVAKPAEEAASENWDYSI